MSPGVQSSKYHTFLKSVGEGTNSSISNLSTPFLKLSKPHGAFFNLSIYNSSTTDFNLANSAFLANWIYQLLLRFLSQILLHI